MSKKVKLWRFGEWTKDGFTIVARDDVVLLPKRVKRKANRRKPKRPK